MRWEHIGYLLILVYGIVLHYLLFGDNIADKYVWAEQIELFAARDPRTFDTSITYTAYGYPGTTIVALASIFHSVAAVPALQALKLAVSCLVAGILTVSTAFCMNLRPQSLWWLAVAATLLLSRFHLTNPATSVAMHLSALAVLATWWLYEQPAGRRSHFLVFGMLVGMFAATRVDVAAMMCLPMAVVLLVRHGRNILMPLTFGALIGLIVFDPFLWFMPLQHAMDVVHKFTHHYKQFRDQTRIPFSQLAVACTPALLSGILLIVLLFSEKKREIMPAILAAAMAIITLATTAGVFSSSNQAVRYFYPVLIVWEVLLPLFLMIVAEKIPQGKLKAISQPFIVVTTIAAQLVLLLVQT